MLPAIGQARVGTIDSFIGEESSVVILTMVVQKDLRFTKDADRLAVAYSRAMDSLIIFNNYTSIKQRRGYDTYNTMVEYYKSIGAFREYSTKDLQPLSSVDIEDKLIADIRAETNRSTSVAWDNDWQITISKKDTVNGQNENVEVKALWDALEEAKVLPKAEAEILPETKTTDR